MNIEPTQAKPEPGRVSSLVVRPAHALCKVWSSPRTGWEGIACLAVGGAAAFGPLLILLSVCAVALAAAEYWPLVAYHLFPPAPLTDVPPEVARILAPKAPVINFGGLGLGIGYWAGLVLTAAGTASLAGHCFGGTGSFRRGSLLAAASVGPALLIGCALELVPGYIQFREVVLLLLAYGAYLLEHGFRALHGFGRWRAIFATLLVGVSVGLYVAAWIYYAIVSLYSR